MMYAKRSLEGGTKKYVIAAISAAVVLVLVYAFSGNDSKLYKDSPVVGYINGKAVHQLEADNIVKALITSNDGKQVLFIDLDEKSKNMIIREVAAQRAILKEANSEGIKEDNDTKIKVTEYRNKLIRDKILAKIANTEVTQDKLLAKYNEIEKTVKGKIQIKVSHILVNSESDARTALEHTKKDSFAKVAKEMSVDGSNKDRGGDLGYLIEGTMDPDFEKAALSLRPGEISNPVKTKFGWHIIELQEKKIATVAPFEALKARIAQDLYNEALKKHAEELLKDVKIELANTSTDAAATENKEDKKEADDTKKPEETKDEVQKEEVKEELKEEKVKQ